MRVNRLRSRMMRAVRRFGTAPELRVRKLLHALGFRFRLNRGDLPGTPDIVLSKFRTVIFVHGCFWHRHSGCAKTTTPRTRAKFWREKFEANTERDQRKSKELEELGWRVAIIWECETKDWEALEQRLRHLLENPARGPVPAESAPRRTQRMVLVQDRQDAH